MLCRPGDRIAQKFLHFVQRGSRQVTSSFGHAQDVPPGRQFMQAYAYLRHGFRAVGIDSVMEDYEGMFHYRACVPQAFAEDDLAAGIRGQVLYQ